MTPAVLPASQRRLALDTVASTNGALLERAAAGEPAGLWVTAREQAAGRGRSGRAWASPAGNLYASFLVRPRVGLAIAQQLSLAVPVAAYDAVATLAGGTPAAGLQMILANA